MSTRIGAIVMAVLLALYIALVGWRAVLFLGSGEPAGIGIGVALIVLPMLAVWALMRELMFGARSEALVRRLDDEGRYPDEELPRRESGRADRGVATENFTLFRGEVEAAPESWQAWLRLGLAYDAAGDRRRARHAVRQAIAADRERH